MCPIDCAEAHWAWLARGVDFAALEVEGAEALACLADGVDFGMGCGVVVEGYGVARCGNDFAIFDYYGSEWSALVLDVFVGDSDGFEHEFFVVFHSGI